MANQPTTKTVAYTTDEGVQRRLIVGRLTPMGSFRYNVLLREANEWLESQGISPTWENAENEGDEIIGVRLHTAFRAQSLSSLKRVEESKDGEKWRTVETPAEWSTVEDFMNDVPITVLNDWVRAAQAVNPGLWVSVLDDTEKNDDSASRS